MDTAAPIELRSFVRTSSIVDEVWGPSPNADVARARFDTLASFLLHFEEEKEFEQAREDDIIATIRAFRQYPGKRKSELRIDSESVPARSSSSSDGPNFDLVVRCMFLTACSTPRSPTMGGHSIFRPRWKESESLERYLARVFPVTRAPQQDLTSFRLQKLSASYLGSFACVRIGWTDKLSDHLILLKGEGWKILYLFRHLGFLKVSLDVLGDADEDTAQTPLEALKLGCLPPSLLKETLMTLAIIFPVVGDNASRGILEREVEKNGVDKHFLEGFHLDSRGHEWPSDALDPSDIRSLYQKYPYWADRLYDLWREADNPTPTTRIERWTEARRHPRFSYWCTVISILIAISFGVFAIALSAIQVWISWCTWVDDPTVPQCQYKKGS
ncbi:hypothetical protein GGR51DRAFT_559815 [Nemania sp. FL0031]|nr:hypothetical protein GGR51DRAFT_559815 [Nemania sp. FL0031]